ncbi:sialic acid-binding Ig-like lectin 8 [Bombina bombina]|uniref:sialic acid-binding Ig-like lectin 8 n=1 Tax=Bombina bombina TaxID=8345 RepID=UPI00235B1E8F|nr:sialic acid-binding Ig-like lectin 8 [Bombina bombina]
MEVLKSLLLLWCFQELIQCYGDNRYCADQVEALRVKAGDTVTIPCRISYPKDWDEHTTVSVSWRETNSTPCGNARFIYNHTDKWTDDKYKGRLSIVGNWNQHKEASLIIQELKTTDGPRFCCRVEIKNKEREQRWQNSHTTLLRFQGDY